MAQVNASIQFRALVRSEQEDHSECGYAMARLATPPQINVTP
jgi:hypothetical protein